MTNYLPGSLVKLLKEVTRKEQFFQLTYGFAL